MRRYYIGLVSITIVMVLLSFLVKWTGMEFFAPVPTWMLPLATLYFAVVHAVQYWLTVSNINKKPKAFIQFFLSTTVVVLLLHLVVLIGGVLSHPMSGKRFAVGFMILYVVYTVYVTVMFVRFARHGGEQ
jgi:hypothetical protein